MGPVPRPCRTPRRGVPYVPRGAMTRAAVLEPQVSAHSGDSVRALCSVLAAIAVVLPSMRYQPPLQHAGAGLGGQTAPPARLQAPVVPCRAGGRTALLGAFLPAHALARLCWHTQTMWNLQRRALRGVGGGLGLLRAIMRSKSGTRRQIVPSSSR